MKRSAEDVAEVLVPSVTVTSTGPAPCAGEVATSSVALSTVTLAANVVPKDTVAVGAKPVPVTVTCVPPTTGPVDGLIPATEGADSKAAGLTDPLGGSGRKARLSPIHTSVALVTVLVQVGNTTGPGAVAGFVATSSASLSVLCIPPELCASKPRVVGAAVRLSTGIVVVVSFSITTERARSWAAVVVKAGALNVAAPVADAEVNTLAVFGVVSKGFVDVTPSNAATSADDPLTAVPWTVIVTASPDT